MAMNYPAITINSISSPLLLTVFSSIPKCFFLMIRRPPRSTLSSSSAASDVYKRQVQNLWVWCGTNCTKMQNWDFNSTLGLPEATIISLRMHEMHGWSTFSLSIGGSFKKFHLDPNSLELALLKNRFQAVSKPTYCMDVTVCVFLSPISVTFMLFFSAAYTFVMC